MALHSSSHSPEETILISKLAMWKPGQPLPEECWSAVEASTGDLCLSAERITDPNTVVLRATNRLGVVRNEIGIILADGRSVEFPLDIAARNLTGDVVVGPARPEDREKAIKCYTLDDLAKDATLLPLDWTAIKANDNQTTVYVSEASDAETRGDIAVRHLGMTEYYGFANTRQNTATTPRYEASTQYDVLTFRGRQELEAHLIPEGYGSGAGRTPCIQGWFIGGIFVQAKLSPELVKFYQKVVELKSASR
jgi:hypothetical protein